MSADDAAREIVDSLAPESGTVWLSIVNGEVSAWTAGLRPSAQWRALGACLQRNADLKRVANAIRRVAREQALEPAAVVPNDGQGWTWVS